MTSTPLPSSISISLWGSTDKKSFERIVDVLDWCEIEAESWATDVRPSNNRFAQFWNEQRAHLNAVKQFAAQLENTAAQLSQDPTSETHKQQLRTAFAELNNRLQLFTDGRAISSKHPHFSQMQAIAEVDPDAAATLLIACLANGHQTLANFHRLDAIARIGPASALLDTARRKTISSLKAELSKLRSRVESDLSELRLAIDEQASQTTENLQEHTKAVGNREKLWTDLLAKCEDDWTELKKVYDEKLALLAPTDYWRARSESHNALARTYALAFGGAILISIGLFIRFGIGHLESPETESVVLAVLPVLVPAFAGIWVLRILGRLLSENLKIAQDAHERETMVKTFLALMRDETTGRSVVTEEDRKLILHALFRQSTVTATDDAPPLNWLETVLRKK